MILISSIWLKKFSDQVNPLTSGFRLKIMHT